METQIILFIDMEACGKINMQASQRRNQNQNQEKGHYWSLTVGNKAYVAYDKVRFGGNIWVCGRKHESSDEKKPG